MEILTERLRLRDFVLNDWADVLAYQQDPRYLQFYHWINRTEPEVRRFVQMFVEQQRQQPRYQFQLAITLRGQETLIGNCGIRLEGPEEEIADIGYELDPKHWGNGYATEAATAVLDFGFDRLDLHRVWAHCIAENVASVRVLQKLGMTQEGRLRQNEWMKGRWWDTLVFAIL